MPKVNVEISYVIGNGDRLTLNRTLEVSQRSSDELVSLGGGNWPYAEQAERLICDMLKREVLPDVATSIQKLDELREHGVKSLSYSFIDEKGEQIGSTVIYPD